MFVIPGGLSEESALSPLFCLLVRAEKPPPTPGGSKAECTERERRWRRRRRALGLAVDGGTVCFGFPRRADYPHETVSELLQDQALRFGLRLMSLFRLFGLFQQTLARRFQHLLRYERVRQPAGKKTRPR